MATIYAGPNPITGAHRLYDTSTNTYSLSSTPPSQETLNATSAAVTFDGQNPNSGLYVYTVNETGKKLYSSEELPTQVTALDNPTPIESPPGETTAAASNPSTATATGEDYSLPDSEQHEEELSAKLDQSGPTEFTAISNNTEIQPREQTAGSSITLPSVNNTNELKVIIRQMPEVGDFNELVFNVMPRITESGGAEYDAVTPIHHPGTIQKYRNSTARTWGVSGKLVSRTPSEASMNLQILNMIRSWRMPFYGQGTIEDLKSLIGAPPPILTLTAYGPNMIGPAPCVLTNYSWDFDNQLDYIPTLDGNPFPVMLDISLSLTESLSPAEFSRFSILKYKTGNLGENGAFKKSVASKPTAIDDDAVGYAVAMAVAEQRGNPTGTDTSQPSVITPATMQLNGGKTIMNASSATINSVKAPNFSASIPGVSKLL